MNLGRSSESLLQFLQRKRGAAGDLENGRLASTAELGGIGYLRSDIKRNHNCAVAVGMNQVAGANQHAGDPNFSAEAVCVNISMRGSDRAGKRLKAGCPLWRIADRTIGDDAKAAQRLVHRALHLAPERSESDIGAIHIL